MSGYRINGGVKEEELSLPSHVPLDKTYTPQGGVVAAGTPVIDGVVVVEHILTEFNPNAV